MKNLVSFCTTALVVVLLLATTIFSAGCSCLVHSDSSYSPKATSDGTGGAIVVYEDVKGSNERDFYVQKIDSGGKSLWGEKGVLIGSGYKYNSAWSDLKIVGDTDGGAFIGWLARPSNQGSFVDHLTRIDSEGRILWQKDFVSIGYLMSDGAGGAIIASDYTGGASYDDALITRVDSQGNLLWGPEGVAIVRKGYQLYTLQLASAGAGGVIVIWEELESQPGPAPHNPNTTQRIVAQRIDARGSLSWGENGVILCATPENISIEEPYITSNGSGGAIAVWHQSPKGRIESGSPEALLQDLCVQSVDAGGNILWQQNGVPLEINKVAGIALPHTPLLVNDGSGGAIIIWEDLRHGLASIYAQRVGPDGTIKWQPGGVQACYIKSDSSLVFRQIASDGLGGAIVSCSFREAGTSKKGVLVQRLDSAGKTVWSGNGIVVTGSDTTGHFISSDGQGGALVAWSIGKGMFSSEKSYVQKIDTEGNLMWGEEGIRLNP